MIIFQLKCVVPDKPSIQGSVTETSLPGTYSLSHQGLKQHVSTKAAPCVVLTLLGVNTH